MSSEQKDVDPNTIVTSLNIHIESAENLHVLCSGQDDDEYSLKVTVGEEVYTTKKLKGKHPTWSENFICENVAADAQVHFELLSGDTVKHKITKSVNELKASRGKIYKHEFHSDFPTANLEARINVLQPPKWVVDVANRYCDLIAKAGFPGKANTAMSHFTKLAACTPESDLDDAKAAYPPAQLITTTIPEPQTFTNWAGNQSAKNVEIFHPDDKESLKQAISYAKDEGKRIRVTGSTHSVSPMFCSDNEVIISNKDLKNTKFPGNMPTFEQTGYGGLLEFWSGTDVGTIGYAMKQNHVCTTSNVISDLFTWGGTVSTGCHGGGWNEKMVPDFVTQIKLIDWLGNDRTFNQEICGDNWNSLVLNLGTIGVVYKIQIRCVKMKNVRIDYRKRDYKTLLCSGDPKEFKDLVTKPNFNEMFWVPLTEKFYVMNFHETTAAEKNVDKWKEHKFWDTIITVAFGGISQWVLSRNTSKLLVEAFGALTLFLFKNFPSDSDEDPDAMIINIVDALAWKSGYSLQIVKFESVEMGLPMANVEDDATWTKIIEQITQVREIIQNDYVDNAAAGEHEWQRPVPFNLPMELRFIGASDQIMATAARREASAESKQSGTYEHHCMIEVLCAAGTPGGAEALNKVYQFWKKNYPDLRTHWCKSTKDIDPTDQNFVKLIKNSYKNEIPQFLQARRNPENLEVANPPDPNNMFVNDWLDTIMELPHKKQTTFRITVKNNAAVVAKLRLSGGPYSHFESQHFLQGQNMSVQIDQDAEDVTFEAIYFVFIGVHKTLFKLKFNVGGKDKISKDLKYEMSGTTLDMEYKEIDD